jgi:hypothetical protein
MTLEETMQAIEQDEFSAEMSLAAGTKAFRRAVRAHELFRRLSDLAKETPLDVSARIDAIAKLEVDERYENPFDAALSAYVMALSDIADPKIVQEAAQAVLKTPKCWWASGIARKLVLETIAVGTVGVGFDWREAIYVRVNDWLRSAHSSKWETTTRELVKAMTAGQPAGQRNNIIELPPQRERHHHAAPRLFTKRKQQRASNTGKARKRA